MDLRHHLTFSLGFKFFAAALLTALGVFAASALMVSHLARQRLSLDFQERAERRLKQVVSVIQRAESQKVLGLAQPRLSDGQVRRLETLLQEIAPDGKEAAAVSWVIKDHKGSILYHSAAAARPRFVETFGKVFSTSLPLMQGKKRIGEVQVFYSPGYFMGEVFQQGRDIFLVFFAALITSLAVVLYIVAYALIFRPVQKILLGLESVAAGDYTQKIALRSRDELGLLGERFNHLVDELQGSQKVLDLLFDASKTVTSRLNVEEATGRVLELAHKKLRLPMVAVLGVSEDGLVRIKDCRGISLETANVLRLHPQEGALGYALTTLKPQILKERNEADPALQSFLEKAAVSACVLVPFAVEQKPLGVLAAFFKQTEPLSPRFISALATLADYLAISIKNAGMVEEAQNFNRRLETEVSATTEELTQTNLRLIQRVREQRALSDLLGFAVSRLDRGDVAQAVLEKVREIAQAESAGLFFFDPKTGELGAHPGSFEGRLKETAFSRLQAPGLFRAMESPAPVIFNSLSKEEAESLGEIARRAPLASFMGVSLKSSHRLIGVLALGNKKTGKFSHEDTRSLLLLASQLVQIFENIYLFEENEKRIQDLEMLKEVSATIASEPNLEKILTVIAHRCARALGAEMCAFLLVDDKTDELVMARGAFGMPEYLVDSFRISLRDEKSGSARTLREGKSFLSQDALEDSAILPGLTSQTQTRGLMILPLKTENKNIGVLRIASHRKAAFSEEHLRLASLIADQAASIIGNASLYERLRDANKNLARLNKVKNEFISVVSHELRTPMTAIKGFVNVVLGEEVGGLNAQQKRFLKIADESIDRLTALISDLLDISKIESGRALLRPVPVSISKVAEKAAERFSGEAEEHGVRIASEIPRTFPEITGDPDRLAQVIDNLLSNAIKFTPSGGVITLTLADRGDWVMLSVADTGTGIPASEHEKIFEKFYQVDSTSTRPRGGTGLGLSIVKGIVELHGGRIWVESEVGKGSIFQVMLPKLRRDAPARAPRRRAAQRTA